MKTITRNITNNIQEISSSSKFMLNYLVFKKGVSLKKAAESQSIKLSQAKQLIKKFKKERHLLKKFTRISRNRAQRRDIFINCYPRREYNDIQTMITNKHFSVSNERIGFLDNISCEIVLLNDLMVEFQNLYQNIIFNHQIFVCLLVIYIVSN